MSALRSIPGLAMALLAVACASEEPVTQSEEAQRTFSVISVDRNDPASVESQGSASGVARFISLPAYAETTRALELSGAALEIPAVDTCENSDDRQDLGASSAMDSIELVEAGDVTIDAAGITTPLVPHAFPSVGSFASGVLYATRDRMSSALPSAVAYGITATGSSQLAPLHLAAEAPEVLSQVTVAGGALGDAIRLESSGAIDLTWQPGEQGDFVYVELLGSDGSPSVTCTFRDEAGAGTVPEGTFLGVGPGRLSIHRLRILQPDDGTPLLSSELRFDFQVGASVEFAR